MTAAQLCLGALVLVPLAASCLAALVPWRTRAVLGIAAAGLVLAAACVTAAAVSSGDVLELPLGGYEPPLGIMLRADGLSIVFLLLSAIVGSLVTVVAASLPTSTGQRLVTAADGTSLRWAAGSPAFWPLWMGAWAGVNAVMISGDLFNAYVGLEIVGLTGVGLVALGGRDAWEAALRYLYVAVLGSLLLLVAIGLLVSATGTLDIVQSADVLARRPEHHLTVMAALVLATIGLCLKIALVPMHRWLIPAHAGAPAAVSPLLSALVIKASLVVFLRLWIWLAGPALSGRLGEGPPPDPQIAAAVSALAWILGGLGVLALLGGSVLALMQDHLKPLIAYSTVGQVGYWFLMMPVLIDPESDSLPRLGVATWDDDSVFASAVAGSVSLALGHGLAKAALFLGAGFLKETYGTDETAALRGAGPRMPMLVLGMGMAGVGLAGLPISLGFSGKWQVATAAVGSAHYWILPVIIAGTLLAAAYLVRALSPLLIAAEDDHAAVMEPDRALSGPPLWPQLAVFALGALTILSGFLGFWVSDMLEVGAPW